MKIKFEIEFEDGKKLIAEDEFVSDANPQEFFEKIAPYRSADEAKKAVKAFEEEDKTVQDFIAEGFEEDASSLFEEYWYGILRQAVADIADVDWD